MRTNTKARTHQRPAHGIEIRLFYPRYGEWLTLDQYQYLKSLNGVEPGTAALSSEAVREEVSASGLSEVLSSIPRSMICQQLSC